MKRTVKHSCRGSRQAYVNKTKFIPDKHEKDHERLNAEQTSNYTSLCCQRCSEIIRWKLSYGHYQPLTEMRKCNLCQCKTIIFAYHHICQSCAEQQAKCAKCQKHISELLSKNSPYNILSNEEDAEKEPNYLEDSSIEDSESSSVENKLLRLHGLDTNRLKKQLITEHNAQTELSLEGLRERDRRTFYRHAASKE